MRYTSLALRAAIVILAIDQSALVNQLAKHTHECSYTHNNYCGLTIKYADLKNMKQKNTLFVSDIQAQTIYKVTSTL